jgi:hypothetical protein
MRQMKIRKSEYPIGELILREFQGSKLGVSSFVEFLGYKNTTKGIRALDAWLEGKGCEFFIDRFQTRFPETKSEVEMAIAQTREIISQREEQLASIDREERRKRFAPYIIATTEFTRPTSICQYALLGGPSRETIPLTGFTFASREDALDHLPDLKWLIDDHYRRADGRTLFMGRITGYLFHFAFDVEPIAVSQKGDVTSNTDLNEPTEASLNVGGKKLSKPFMRMLVPGDSAEEDWN